MAGENEGSLLENKYKTNMIALDLFDKVINVKLYVSAATKKDENGNVVERVDREFIIRSDFEICYPSQSVTKIMLNGAFPTDKYIIRKSRFKPSIKIQYNQFSGGLATQVDIFLSNFYMLGSDGRQLMNFNMQDYKVTRIDLMLGYYPQFKSQYTSFEDITIKDLFDFSSKKAINGVTVIENCLPLYINTDKLPPDYDLHINCIKGNVTRQPFDYAKVLETSYSDLEASKNIQVFSESDKSDAEKLLYKYITKRFVNEAAMAKDKVDEITFDDDGTMTDESAAKYGVKCITSPLLDEWKIPKIKGSTKNQIERQLYEEPSVITVDAMLTLIGETFGLNLASKRLDNGKLVVYLDNEESDYAQLGEDMFDKLYEEFKDTPCQFYWQNKLPAVYNITSDVITMIVCPFFFTVNPLQIVQFKNRYAIGTLTSYITSFDARLMSFLVISSKIAFATVEDLNEMQITCVGRKKGEEE